MSKVISLCLIRNQILRLIESLKDELEQAEKLLDENTKLGGVAMKQWVES